LVTTLKLLNAIAAPAITGSTARRQPTARHIVVNHAGEARRMVREGYEPVLKNKRWCLLKRPENLTDKQNVSLRPESVTALATTTRWAPFLA